MKTYVEYLNFRDNFGDLSRLNNDSNGTMLFLEFPWLTQDFLKEAFPSAEFKQKLLTFFLEDKVRYSDNSFVNEYDHIQPLINSGVIVTVNMLGLAIKSTNIFDRDCYGLLDIAIEQGLDLNTKFEAVSRSSVLHNGGTLLNEAISSSIYYFAKKLLEAGVDPMLTDNNKDTALHKLGQNSKSDARTEVLELILECDYINPFVTGNFAKTAIGYFTHGYNLNYKDLQLIIESLRAEDSELLAQIDDTLYSAQSFLFGSQQDLASIQEKYGEVNIDTISLKYNTLTDYLVLDYPIVLINNMKNNEGLKQAVFDIYHGLSKLSIESLYVEFLYNRLGFAMNNSILNSGGLDFASEYLNFVEHKEDQEVITTIGDVDTDL